MPEEPIVLGDRPANWRRFIGRVLIVTLVVLILAMLWFATRVFLLAFAGVLVALLLYTLSEWGNRYTPLSYGWSLTLVVLLLVALFVLGGWLIGARLVQQFEQLSQQLPQSWNGIEQELKHYEWGQWLAAQTPSPAQALSRTDAFAQVTGVLSTAVGLFVGLIIILFVGLYGAASPQWYIQGVVQLVPLDDRSRVETALRRTGDALRWWLLGQLVTMAAVGVATGMGLWLVGIPLALSLGLLAFFLEIIPNFGPILAAIPALLIAWTQGTTEVLYVVLVYVVVQGLESYVVLPLVQQRAVRLPPALTILTVVLFGLVAGFLGVLVAAPLTVAGIVLVKMLYVKDVLGDPHVKLPGSSSPPQ